MILKNSVQHLFVRQAKHESCEHPINELNNTVNITDSKIDTHVMAVIENYRIRLIILFI